MPKFEVKVERDITETYSRFIFADTLDDAQAVVEERYDADESWHDTVEWERTDVTYSCGRLERITGKYTTFMITEHQEAEFDLDVMMGGTDYTCFKEESGSFFIAKTHDEQIDRDYEVEPNRYYFLTYADAKKVALAFIAEELFVKKIYEEFYIRRAVWSLVNS